nr:immunoglobulin light chain junction region [Macaca mulatta]
DYYCQSSDTSLSVLF